MVGCMRRVLLVLCLGLLGWAQGRGLRDQADGNGTLIIDPPPPEPLLPEPPAGPNGIIRPTLPPFPPTAVTPNAKASPLHAIISNKINPEISEDLFEGDIVLTPEQRLIMQGRKAINPAYYWPADSSGTVTVGYRFGDDIINEALVRVAIAQWEANTCIRFEEVASDVGEVHLNFVDADFCVSFLGRVSSMTSGQTIWLHPKCVNNIGSTVHEIGHAIGFNHEQSRSDRDDHVKVMWDNIETGKEGNFDKKTTYNNGVPYDYSSVMHYGPSYFSSNGLDTLVAYNPVAQLLMGNREGLSFADKLLANTMYNCLGQWLTECSLSSDPCQNMGYTGPDCNCVCPEGTSGNHCEVLQDSYTDALIKLKNPFSETITTEGVVSTPGYPTPIQTPTKFVKVLVAPDCYRVSLNVTDLNLYRRSSSNSCSIDALNIRTQDALGTGIAYCGEEIAPGTVFLSETTTIVLDYFNYDYTTVSWDSRNRGFSATIEHIPADNCTAPPTAPPPTTTPLTTSPPSIPGVTFINSGNVPLTVSASSSGSCTLKRIRPAGSYRINSPGFPSSYTPEDSCDVVLETSEPRYVRVTGGNIRITRWDKLFLNSLFGQQTEVTRSMKGQSSVFPSSAFSFSFTAGRRKTGKSFSIRIEVLNSDCHQIIQVESGATGFLARTNYGPDTVCEVWIQAPEGKEIQVDFSSFAVGQSDCSTDYLALDTSGDPRYETAPQQFCGTTSPGSVTSSGGRLNVLFYGLVGGNFGFTATYRVV